MTYRVCALMACLLLAGCDFFAPAPPPAPRAVKPPPDPVPQPARDIALRALSLSADGKYALTGYRVSYTGDADRWQVMQLWDLTGQPKVVRTYKQGGPIVMVGFLPDGKRVVSADDSAVRAWDRDSGKMLWEARPFAHQGVRAVVASPDGTGLLTYGCESDGGEAGRWHCRLELLSADSGKLLRIFDAFDETPDLSAENAIVFSPDGKRAYVRASVLNVETGEVRPRPAGAGGEAPPWIWALSPDGRLFVTEIEEGAHVGHPTYHLELRETDTGKMVRGFAKKEGRIPGLPPYSRGASFGPDGKAVLSLDGDYTLRRWDAGTGQEVWSAALEGEDGNAFEFSADGRFLLTVYSKIRGTGYTNVRFHLWNAVTGETLMRSAGDAYAPGQ